MMQNIKKYTKKILDTFHLIIAFSFKVYKKGKDFYKKTPLKAIVFIGLFFLSLSVLLGEYNVFSIISRQSRIAHLQNEYKIARRHFIQDSLELSVVRNDTYQLEHIARERYGFKQPEEVIFRIVEKKKK